MKDKYDIDYDHSPYDSEPDEWSDTTGDMSLDDSWNLMDESNTLPTTQNDTRQRLITDFFKPLNNAKK